MTVKEVSRITGVSVRALHHYDEIGLLKPSGKSESGYRLYDENALERLQQILLFRSLEFPLKEIKAILDRPDFDPKKALQQQIEMLELKKEHIENLILFAKGLKLRGTKNLKFDVFDAKKLDDYAARAKESWGRTDAWKEFEQKSKGRTKQQDQLLAMEIMDIFRRFGEMRNTSPESSATQALVRELQEFYTAHFYNCTNKILLGLAAMYDGGGEFTESIDSAAGEGTAAFAAAAIRAYTEE